MDDARLVQEVHADCGVARQREHHARVDNGGLVLQQPRAGLSFGRPSFYSIRAARSSTEQHLQHEEQAPALAVLGHDVAVVVAERDAEEEHDVRVAQLERERC